jgi:UPF0176 protein
MNYYVTTCYRFVPLLPEDVSTLKLELEAFASATGLLGLALVGPEGFNLTVAGSEDTVAQFKSLLQDKVTSVAKAQNLEAPESDAPGSFGLVFKDSTAPKAPFREFVVKVKKEIVTLGRPGLAPDSPHNAHLTPAEWNQALRDPDTVVIDTRNDYEVEIGKFKSAVDFKIKEFRDFPKAIAEANIPKDKQVLIYCTGGIRCEKAILDMREQGFAKIHQLEGGILNYLKEFPEGEFEGECFVFDYRVAVDQKLQPSQKFLLCPHCGQPAEKNQEITCSMCGTKAAICTHCRTDLAVHTCSKNCAHHAAIGSDSRKAHTQELRKRHKI